MTKRKVMSAEYVLMVPNDYNEIDGTNAREFVAYRFKTLGCAKAVQRSDKWQWSFIAKVEVRFDREGRPIGDGRTSGRQK
jgi:hypothetical protein